MKKFAFTYILATTLAFAQSGDISGSTSNFTTLGGSILKLLVALAGLGFVGLIIWGGLTLTTNRAEDSPWWAVVWRARCWPASLSF